MPSAAQRLTAPDAGAPTAIQPGLRERPTDTMAQRLKACTACHGAEGRAAPDGYQPRIAGKPAGYLHQQLRHFREGQRRHAVMQAMLQPLSDAYLGDIATHFAELHLPYPPPAPTRLTDAQRQRGEQLVLRGDARLGVPACADCHGAAGMGRQPAVPGLLGLPADYLAGQLGAWRTGARRTAAPDCMATVAQRLAPGDVVAVAGWLAAQAVPDGARPERARTTPMPLHCGTGLSVAPIADTHSLPVPTGRSVPVSGPSNEPLAALRAQGAYLVRLGNCLACHTAPGAEPGAGGRPVDTPYGRVYSSNLTPHRTGLGGWTADDFWRALHEGRSRDGRPLSPAFPYTAFTRITRADSDAIFAYLRALTPVDRPARAAEMRWPMGESWAIELWRALFFKPGVYATRSDRDAVWNRGAYLVQGVAHCGECHAPRGWLASPARGTALAGGQMQPLGWVAPALGGPLEAESLAQLLLQGRSPRGTALGPMAEVVAQGTQHLRPDDVAAITRYVATLTPPPGPAAASVVRGSGVGAVGSKASATAGSALYGTHCASCHGDDGAGEGLYPALVGNRTVLLDEPDNLIKVIRQGGFSPSTPAQPLPFGMPPFGHRLTQSELAAVASHVRSSWGNQASPVTELQVLQTR